MISDVRNIIRYWWLFSLLGGVLIFFGVLVFNCAWAAYPRLTSYFIIAFSLNGLFEIGFAMANRQIVRGWGWHLAGGLFDLMAAAVLFFTPVLAAVSLPLFAGFWLLFRSISIVGRCFDLPMNWQEKLWMMILGGAGLVFSFLILYHPVAGSSGLVKWTSLALLSIGLFYMFLGIHLRRWNPGK